MIQAASNKDNGYFFADTQGRIMHGNETLREMGQYAYAALEGSLVHHLFCNADGGKQDVLPKMNASKESCRVQTHVWRKKGKPIPVWLSVRHVVNDQGKASGYEGSVVLVKQDAPQKSGKSLSHILKNNPSPMIHVSKDGAVMFANQASAILLSTLGGAVGKVVSRGWRNWISQVVSMKQVMEIDVACLGIDYDCKFVPQTDGVLIYAVDVTDRKANEENLALSKDMLMQHGKAQQLALKAEKQVRHVSEKALLEAEVTRNTSNDKHEQHVAISREAIEDLNNMLAVVMGNASLVAAEAEGNIMLVKRAKCIAKATQAAVLLCEGLVGDSRKGEQAVAYISLTETLKHADDLLGDEALDAKTSLNFNHSVDTLYIKANKQSVQRTLMNLILNAVDSMQGSHGVVQVSADFMEVSQAYIERCHGFSEAKAGCYAYIEVEDNGCGMNEQTLLHLFVPLRSSKGQGHGLGMDSALRLTHENKGLVHVDSELGKGSKMRLLFPLVNDEVSVQGKVNMLLQAAAEHQQVAEALQ